MTIRRLSDRHIESPTLFLVNGRGSRSRRCYLATSRSPRGPGRPLLSVLGQKLLFMYSLVKEPSTLSELGAFLNDKSDYRVCGIYAVGPRRRTRHPGPAQHILTPFQQYSRLGFSSEAARWIAKPHGSHESELLLLGYSYTGCTHAFVIQHASKDPVNQCSTLATVASSCPGIPEAHDSLHLSLARHSVAAPQDMTER